MVTPFDRRLRVDFEAAAAIADRLVKSGSDGVVVGGSTGESSTLSDEEKLSLFREVRRALPPGKKVIAGVGTYNTEHTIHLATSAEAVGVDGLLVVTPYYNKPPDEGLYAHFRAVAEATTLPILLYDIPGRTGKEVPLSVILKLAELENIVGVKDSCRNLEKTAQIVARAPDRFALYSGDDALTLPMLSVGGCGVVSVASHLVGKRIAAMISAFTAGRIKRAQAIHWELLDLFEVLFISTNPIPIKEALALAGWKVGGVRPPLSPLSREKRRRLRDVLKRYKLLS